MRRLQAPFRRSGHGKLSGFAYVDGNNNGVKDAGEVGIPGVTITLTGTPTGGSTITLARDDCQ